MTVWQRRLWLAGLVALFCASFPERCPAPLIWRRDEGWSYERFGVPSGKTPQEQLDIARRLRQERNYGDAITAYRRLTRRWPTAFAAQTARLELAECLSATDYHFRAFQEYQTLITKHPNSEHYDTAVQRQFDIGERFLNGQKHKVWGLRWFPGLEKGLEVFEQIVKNGPYGKMAPLAQLRVGAVHEKMGEYVSAVKAYETFLERYPKHDLAETAQFNIGLAYRQQASRAEYDQNAADQAGAAFTDFITRYPKSAKVAEAEKYRADLRGEQTRGLFRIGEFYEKNRQYKAALIYFNEVIEHNPRSPWADKATRKIASLTPQLSAPAPASKKSAKPATPTESAPAVPAPAAPAVPAPPAMPAEPPLEVLP